MTILTIHNLSFSFGTNSILKNVSFSMDETEKCGFVGVNGTGKSTLFRLINGEYLPDEGNIQISKNISIDYFRQDNTYESTETIGDAIKNVFKDVLEMEERIKELEEQISRTAESDIQAGLIKKYDNLRVAFELAGGYEYQSRIRGVMHGLDLGDGIGDTTSVNILSGGQKTRLSLALMLIKPPDLLLLDEPTNHLDIHSLQWLENYLKSFKGCCFIISHDRYFLDVVTDKTLELEHQSLKKYNGNYSAAMKKKAADSLIQERHYINQQNEIKRQEAYIEQQRRWNRQRNIIAAESRQKALDRMEKVERPKTAPKKINIRFRNSIVSSNDILFIEAVSKSFDGRLIFDKFTSLIKRNERVFLLGPNGCGKSTFLKILAGFLKPDSGYLELANKVSFGYYDQEHFELNESNSILDEAFDMDFGLPIADIRNVLAAFLFQGEDVFKKISVLSGGEKARLALAKLILSKANLLMLDEPTNHLDINSREALEKALADFDGTIIAVSHDRYFIRKLASRILYFDEKQILDFKGDYESYLKYIQNLAAEQEKAASSSAVNGVVSSVHNASAIEEKTISQNKLSWQEAREKRSNQKKTATQIQRIEAEVDAIEKRQAEIEADMALESTISDHVKLAALSTEHHQLSIHLEDLLSEWEYLSALMETLR